MSLLSKQKEKFEMHPHTLLKCLVATVCVSPWSYERQKCGTKAYDWLDWGGGRSRRADKMKWNEQKRKKERAEEEVGQVSLVIQL